MNILIIHNEYGAYSGEEAVVDRQISLFQELGHAVRVYRKTSAGQRGTLLGNIKGLLQGFYSHASVRDIDQIIQENKPDAVVIHNLYPYISPAILKPIQRAGVPIIMTVHNYRLMCPTGLFMRNTAPCELCLGGHEFNCIKHNCEHSWFKSIGYAGRNWYARITRAYMDNVTVYACITAFQTYKLSEAGFPCDRLRVIPNFVSNAPEPEFTEGEYVAISGRISREKGVDLILNVARKTPQIKYVFAGLARKEDDLLSDVPDNCTFVGHLSSKELADFYAKARFLVIASRWYEGFPITILDAFSFGKPVIGPAHGGFLEIIDNEINGLHFIPGNELHLAEKIIQLWNDPVACMNMGRKGYEKLMTTYTLPVVKNQWAALLGELVSTRQTSL